MGRTARARACVALKTLVDVVGGEAEVCPRHHDANGGAVGRFIQHPCRAGLRSALVELCDALVAPEPLQAAPLLLVDSLLCRGAFVASLSLPGIALALLDPRSRSTFAVHGTAERALELSCTLEAHAKESRAVTRGSLRVSRRLAEGRQGATGK